MPKLTYNDTALYYEVHGRGAPLMLIAGLASDSQSWQPVLPALAAHFMVILLDNRGVGRSTQQGAISIGQMCDDCMALSRHLGQEKITLLGHSMGGMVAMECAIRYPQLIENLVLVATAPRTSARNQLLFDDWAARRAAGTDLANWFRSIFAWIFTPHYFDNQTQVDQAIEDQLHYPWPQSAEAFGQQVAALAAYDATPALPHITAATCVLAGALDLLMPVKTVATLAEQLPNARLVVIEGAAHSIHVERPDALFNHVVRFLQRSDPKQV